MKKFLEIVGAWTVVIVFVMGLSYWSELPKYHFEKVAMETAKGMSGSRLISSMKSGDLASPVSWFWPPTTTWNFAIPDPRMQGRFYQYTLRYDDQGTVFLIDVFCDRHEGIWYDLDEPESAFPARDLFGEPVVAPSGLTYRRSKAQTPLPPEWLHQFCETDWTAERKSRGPLTAPTCAP